MQEKGLSAFQLTMMALGTVIGGSFFLATSIAVKAAGPSIILGFVVGGLLVYFILTALSEMTVANPHPGSFRTFAAEAHGPFLGYLVGWVYWTGLVLSMSSEATAAALLIRSWLPLLSLPLLSVIIVAMITLLNLLEASLVSRLETSLAAIKILAIVFFIILAIALIAGLGSGRAPLGMGAVQNAALFPHGIGGLAGSMLIVLLGYAGFEVIGLAASEARDPQKTVPRAIKATVISLLAIYILVIALLLPLVSTQVLSTKVSPMVQALNIHGFGVAAGLVNLVLVTAIISTMLVSVFGLGRMLRSISDNGDAPAFLKERGDVPLRGILFSGLVMLVGVSMSYVLPDRIYVFLVSSGGFSLLFVYLVIMLTHLKFRRRSGCPPIGHCQLAGYPYTNWLAIIGLIAAIVTMPLIPGQGSGLFAGLVLIVIYSISYPLIHKPFARLQPAAKPSVHNSYQHSAGAGSPALEGKAPRRSWRVRFRRRY